MSSIFTPNQHRQHTNTLLFMKLQDHFVPGKQSRQRIIWRTVRLHLANALPCAMRNQENHNLTAAERVSNLFLVKATTNLRLEEDFGPSSLPITSDYGANLFIQATLQRMSQLALHSVFPKAKEDVMLLGYFSFRTVQANAGKIRIQIVDVEELRFLQPTRTQSATRHLQRMFKGNILFKEAALRTEEFTVKWTQTRLRV